MDDRSTAFVPTIISTGEIETDDQAIEWLRSFFKPGQLVLIATGLQELREARYGDFRMVIADGRVQSFKIMKSYQ